MLGKILKKEDCAKCRFCCAFRPCSQWETPIFTQENYQAIEGRQDKTLAEGTKACNVGPLYKLDNVSDVNYYSLKDAYKIDDPEEEAPCPYLDKDKGCLLNDQQKPWDCKIWPLRVVRKTDDSLWIVLTPTCPSVNKLDIEEVRSFVVNELKDQLADYARKHPALIKEDKEDFFIYLVEMESGVVGM